MRAGEGRLGSAAAVAVIHALLGYALITGLGVDVRRAASDSLKLFDVLSAPPPAAPADVPSAADEGTASPPDLEAEAAPVLAPEPVVRMELPPPVAAAPKPMESSDSAAGAAIVPGPGTGSGGIGGGTGSGNEGRGIGSGIARGAELIEGRIRNADYPREASRAEAGGTVIVRYTVGTDGRASGCSILRSSGNADLDATTCRLIERRFRYRPARDAQGRAVPETRGWKQVWWLEPRGG